MPTCWSVEMYGGNVLGCNEMDAHGRRFVERFCDACRRRNLFNIPVRCIRAVGSLEQGKGKSFYKLSAEMGAYVPYRIVNTSRAILLVVFPMHVSIPDKVSWLPIPLEWIQLDSDVHFCIQDDTLRPISHVGPVHLSAHSTHLPFATYVPMVHAPIIDGRVHFTKQQTAPPAFVASSMPTSQSVHPRFHVLEGANSSAPSLELDIEAQVDGSQDALEAKCANDTDSVSDMGAEIQNMNDEAAVDLAVAGVARGEVVEYIKDAPPWENMDTYSVPPSPPSTPKETKARLLPSYTVLGVIATIYCLSLVCSMHFGIEAYQDHKVEVFTIPALWSLVITHAPDRFLRCMVRIFPVFPIYDLWMLQGGLLVLRLPLGILTMFVIGSFFATFCTDVSVVHLARLNTLAICTVHVVGGLGAYAAGVPANARCFYPVAPAQCDDASHGHTLYESLVMAICLFVPIMLPMITHWWRCITATARSAASIIQDGDHGDLQSTPSPPYPPISFSVHDHKAFFQVLIMLSVIAVDISISCYHGKLAGDFAMLVWIVSSNPPKWLRDYRSDGIGSVVTSSTFIILGYLASDVASAFLYHQSVGRTIQRIWVVDEELVWETVLTTWVVECAMGRWFGQSGTYPVLSCLMMHVAGVPDIVGMVSCLCHFGGSLHAEYFELEQSKKSSSLRCKCELAAYSMLTSGAISSSFSPSRLSGLLLLLNAYASVTIAWRGYFNFAISDHAMAVLVISSYVAFLGTLYIASWTLVGIPLAAGCVYYLKSLQRTSSYAHAFLILYNLTTVAIDAAYSCYLDKPLGVVYGCTSASSLFGFYIASSCDRAFFRETSNSS